MAWREIATTSATGTRDPWLCAARNSWRSAASALVAVVRRATSGRRSHDVGPRARRTPTDDDAAPFVVLSRRAAERFTRLHLSHRRFRETVGMERNYDINRHIADAADRNTLLYSNTGTFGSAQQ